ncbi:quinone oxidoreductase family protein [Paraburkholderia megapolitana]|uniref:NADPH:quinone reductase n=1 Tax=Paraburkholderia megapolitana TaxID=420953 RepID=A0A1I3IQE9_9BURK|nr:zinc-binding alcohol dehydrogenase family protein [Paraburkholderia megapolitana]QDQ85095.1 zinc-binding alcohol dehydrogenase family protein [Paraburkholderia megapolitana]SFI50070.1 NADPH:quinone reductase [Paraburkholderia megapolitana]
MKAALVKALGAAPTYADFTEPAAATVEGTVRVTVAASALSHVTKSRASGKHYSGSGTLPFVPGIDGTGTLEDGTRVYFLMPEAPYGGMAEQCIVKKARCIPLPAALDDITAAAIAIPGMSSWAALTERAKLVSGETVLINGATGASGRLAVQIAKYLGAAKVIATGRNEDALRALSAVGADVTISLAQDKDTLEKVFQEQFHAGVDVVLDYLWGPSAESLLIAGAKAAREAVPVRFIQIGAISGPTIALPSAVLRSSPIELMGSGIGSIPMPRIHHAIAQLLNATVPGKFEIAVKPVPLAQVEDYWASDDSQVRVVFTTGHRS